MTTLQSLIFAGMVFGVVMLLSFALIIPTVSSGARASRRMRQRIRHTLDSQTVDGVSLKRDGYHDDNSTNLPANGLQLNSLIQRSGLNIKPAKIIVWSVLLGLGGFIAVYVVAGSWLYALPASLVAAGFPIYRISMIAKRRMNLFEAQLPEALDIMSRALKAGHPFNETLNFVAEEMDDPIGAEFGRVFSDISYGMPSKVAFHAIMERVPSVSLHTLITAVLIQQESGGALAEILEKVAHVIRGRFRLQRKLKTLSAEGRMSAWVLTLLPFILAGMLMLVSPDYLPVLLTDPTGQKIIATGIALLITGAIWIKFIINIRV